MNPGTRTGRTARTTRSRGASWIVCRAAAALLLPQAALPHAPITTTVQFDREIVHILDNHCVMCHFETGPAFPLLTYEQTYSARWKIRQDALDRHMAPWAAVPGYGEFANSNGLTQREIDFLVSWAESFGPRNNGEVYTAVADAPAAPKVIQAHFDPDRWALGPPDLRLALAADTVAPRPVVGPPLASAPHADAAAETRRATVDLKLRSDRWLKALEYKPRDRRAVHAVQFTIEETGQWLGTWTPWKGFTSLPEGLAYRLPAGSHLVADTLYYGPRRDHGGDGTLGLYFADQPSSHAVSNLILSAKAVGPGSPGKLLASTTLDADTTVLAVQPEVHPGLQSVEVFTRTPEGSRQVLLFAKAIPAAWPTPYIYSTPVALHKGAQLTVVEHYDAAAPDYSSPQQIRFMATSAGAHGS